MSFGTSIPSTNTCFSVLGYWYTCPIQGSDPFLNKKNSRTFQGLSGTYFPQHEQFYPKGLSAFAPFSLEFYLNYRVSIEIQGLSSTDCNFQGLSRPWMFLLKYCQYTQSGLGCLPRERGHMWKGCVLNTGSRHHLRVSECYLDYMYVLVYWTTVGIF